MQQNTQDKAVARSELLQTIFGQAQLTAPSSMHQHPQPMSQGFEIYTGLDYTLKTIVTTNTISARNA
ncbi:hypothetical protein BFW87_11500 [Pseudomonas fluorescens]|jgi:hypothetical protein|uniref:Uncharacterized protein n=1 Tax=Pseudomonas fluorescens TaxID=294 RepID=A0A1T2YYS1_PSEFL|nr:hypothetical protein [Pseudomonas fluorescens]OPA96936.1 hypothetical protein BFW87_11500 [Pseudomonas fluorescens]